MRYYKLSYKHRMLPNGTLMQDQRTYAPESLRRHLLHVFRAMADNPQHVRVDVDVDAIGMPVGATIWHKLSERTGLWCIWERVRIVTTLRHHRVPLLVTWHVDAPNAWAHGSIGSNPIGSPLP